MEIYYLKDWEAWKELCELYSFDPYKGGSLKVNEGEGKSSIFGYTGNVPKKDNHVA